MAALECPEEAATQHYLGAGYGFGPVQSSEQVAFAVFETTERDGNRVKATAFQTKQLKRHEVSLARINYMNIVEFESEMRPLLTTQGPLVGIARAQVGKIRALDYNVNGTSERAFCVTDKVTALDFNAHAALGYSENQEALTAKQKSKIRAALHADLADTFGDLISIEEAFKS